MRLGLSPDPAHAADRWPRSGGLQKVMLKIWLGHDLIGNTSCCISVDQYRRPKQSKVFVLLYLICNKSCRRKKLLIILHDVKLPSGHVEGSLLLVQISVQGGKSTCIPMFETARMVFAQKKWTLWMVQWTLLGGFRKAYLFIYARVIVGSRKGSKSTPYNPPEIIINSQLAMYLIINLATSTYRSVKCCLKVCMYN